MIYSSDCLRRYGSPYKHNNLVLWYMPEYLLSVNPRLPKRIYLNKDMIRPLATALERAAQSGVIREIITFDGCFNIRNIRGSQAMSLHSWAVALDFNAAQNPLGMTREQCHKAGLRPFSETFIQCFEDAGFDSGWRFARPDGMHFQLASI